MDYTTDQQHVIDDIQTYLKKHLLPEKSSKVIGHDWKHAFRVRDWGRKLAQGENYGEPFLLEVSCLLHDIGRLREEEWGITHEVASGRLAEELFSEKQWLSGKDKELVAYAIANHSKGGEGNLVVLLRDADKLDGLGAMGIARAFQHHWYLPDYNPANIAKPFTMSKEEITAFYSANPQGALAANVADHLMYQLTWYDHMSTQTGKKLAEPLVGFMKIFIEELKKQGNLPNYS